MQSDKDSTVVIGAGVTGLGAAIASGAEVCEAGPHAGGICRSYYVRPGSEERLPEPPADGGAYRFEPGGGHWLFGCGRETVEFLEGCGPLRSYRRRASVYFPQWDLLVPYPLQYHLGALDSALGRRVLEEIRHPPAGQAERMSGWIEQSFGPTLTELFFGPFHEAYTAGLWTRIAPQDGYKTPVDVSQVEAGLRGEAHPAGYNVGFLYPEAGLQSVASAMAAQCRIEFGSRVTRVDPQRAEIQFAAGEVRRYTQLLSTIPLDRMLALAGLEVDEEPWPYTSVLTCNAGAARGPRCPDAHWIYVPRSASGFHRVGFYSNVDASFLPSPAGDRVSVYIERAYPGGRRPTAEETGAFTQSALRELQSWGFIGEPDAISPTWIETAYTWAMPGSHWREKALAALAANGIRMAGRYGRWQFQGIAESLREGFAAGAALRSGAPHA